MEERPWLDLLKEETFRIIAPDGTLRWEGPGYLGKTTLIVDDVKAAIEVGDEARRLLPNGRDDTWVVVNPRFHSDHENLHSGISPHFAVVLARRGVHAHGTGGHYQVSVSGPNARVNIGSTDNSTNTAASGDLFADVRRAVEAGVSDYAKRAEIIAKIDAVEAAKGTPGILATYQALVGTAADHLGILTPFLPALTRLLG